MYGDCEMGTAKSKLADCSCSSCCGFHKWESHEIHHDLPRPPHLDTPNREVREGKVI